MSDLSKEHQDPSSVSDIDFSDKVSVLCITVNEDNELTYQINWTPNEDGLSGTASVFYNLLFENLGLKIFKELRELCVLNNAELDYLTINQIIHNFLEQSQSQESQTQDEVVVPPDQVFTT